MKRLLARGARRAFGPVVSGLVLLAVMSSGTGAVGAAGARATVPPPFVTLRGTGAWSTFEEITPWHNQLAAAASPIDLRFTPFGSFLGRQDLLAGTADFALSGVGFTPAQLSAAHRTSADFIDAPIAVATLGILTLLPANARPGFQSLVVRCDPNGDPSTWPPGVTDPFDPVNGCIIWTPYSGPVRIPDENLAAMLFQYQLDANGGGIDEPLSSWNDPAVLAAFGVPNLNSVPAKRGPTPVLRSDSDETNYFLQQFAAQYAPSVWSGLQKVDPEAKWEPITEALPRQASASRGEADQQAELIGVNSDPASGTVPFGGAIADVPPAALVAVKSTYPDSKLSFAQLQNANGDWVAPTPASIDAAVDAGGDAPLYAFAHKVPGAYPFVWVDHLYAPAHGLSIAKTEGLATLIRYLATAGQAAAAPVGEGRLSQSLVTQALAAADALVRSNCTGADRQIVQNSDPGPVAPAGGAMAAIGPMLHCEPVSAPTSTTTTSTGPTSQSTTTTSTTQPIGTPTTFSSSALGVTPVTTSTPSSSGGAKTGPRGATATTTPGSNSHASSLLTVAKLPLRAPGGVPGLDRFGTFMLGAALYLCLRRPARRLVRSLVAV